MALPQPGIFALGTNSHAYLEFDLVADGDPSAAVALAAGLREPRTTIGGVNLVTGFRPELWATVAPDAAPEDVRGFNEPLVGPDGYTLPATQHDIVMWLAGARVRRRLRPVARDRQGGRIVCQARPQRPWAGHTTTIVT